MDLVERLAVERVPLAEARPFIYLSESDREFARNFLNEKLRQWNGRLIGIQPGTSVAMRWKQWPVDRYRELIRTLIAERRDTQIVLFGSADEAEITGELARGVESNVIVAAGQTSIKQVAALIQRCSLLVCNDSGLMHAAVAVGTPVVAIYGPTDIRRTAPLGPIHTVVRRELSCSPCFKLEGDQQIHRCPHHDCLMTIAPADVLHEVLAEPARAASGSGVFPC
jgi:lipopolysaccharide heptosyltransferase II